jgi:hypothetical protein
MAKVFVSYSHVQGDWVWSRLVPLLKAYGAEVLIDVERFRGGIALHQQMDDLQDQADHQLLCFSNSYLTSPNCEREWKRAHATDPGFTSGRVIPIKVEAGVTLPPEIRTPNPLYFNLTNDRNSGTWKQLFESLGLHVPCCPVEWLEGVDDIMLTLPRMGCVNLVIEKGLQSRPLIDHLVTAQHPRKLLPDLKTIDLANGECASRPGLLQTLLTAAGIRQTLPKSKPADLVEFSRLVSGLPSLQLAIQHFDMVVTNRREYTDQLFATLYNLTQERKLALLVVSHSPYATLLPADHPISSIQFKTVELKGLR